MICIRCHRPLRLPTTTGMGPVCSKVARAVAPNLEEPDLFGYDITKAVQAAKERVRIGVLQAVATARMETLRESRASHVRLLGWQA